MNNLFNSALRQSTSLRRDLDSLATAPSPSSALLGQISTSLTSLSRTVDEYSALAAQEIHEEKRAKALERTKTFKSELVEYRERFADLKKGLEEKQTVVDRAELLGRRPHHGATPENPYANVQQNSVFNVAPTNGSGQDTALYGGSATTREDHALREHSFMQQTNVALDEFLERGRAVLGDLGEQREMLKGTQRRLYNVANTLGISGDTIRMVERRAKQDKWIFWVGVILFIVFVWLVLHYLR